MKKLLISLLTLVAALTASAGLQPDGTLNGGTNTCLGPATNQYAGTIFNCNNSSQVTFEFSFICTNASAMTAGAGAFFTLDGAINGTTSDLWQSNTLTFFVPNNGNSSNASVLVTNVGAPFPFYRVGQVRNTNQTSSSTTNFTGLKVRCFTKSGI